MGDITIFRDFVKSSIKYRSEACLNIIDSLCSNTSFDSPVKLTLSSLFKRKYSSLYKANKEFSFREGYDLSTIADFCMRSSHDKSSLKITICDATPVKRTAKKLADKQYVYDATSSSPKPVAIGHNHSAVISPILGSNPSDADWAIPFDIKRIPSKRNSAEFGMEQVSKIVSDPKLNFFDSMVLNLADSAYNSPSAIIAVEKDLERNLTHCCRCRGGRVCYKSASSTINKKGHPKWFGSKLKMNNNAAEMLPPDLCFSSSSNSKSGKSINIETDVWTGMVFRGTNDFDAHKFPFSLIRITVSNSQGKKIYKNPLWLCVYGKNRDQLVFGLSHNIYKIRFLIEVFFKFIKRNLLFNKFYTPEIIHGENWSKLIAIAYMQAFFLRKKTLNIYYPWEYNKKYKDANRIASLTEVQRSYFTILENEDIDIKPPKTRGISKGRSRGTKPKKRKNSKIIKKRAESKKELSPDNLQQVELFDGSFKNGKRILHRKDSSSQDQKIIQQSENITKNPNSVVNILPKNICKRTTGPPDYL